MKLTLFALATYMNGDGGSAHPGVARLARDTGLCVRTVRGHLSQARRDGWLTVESNLFGGRGKATVYRAAIPETRQPAAGFEPQKAATSDTKGGNQRHKTRQPTAAHQSRQLQDQAENPAKKKPDCPDHGPGACFFQFGTGWIHPEEGVA
jgi:helix-turn-helix protein